VPHIALNTDDSSGGSLAWLGWCLFLLALTLISGAVAFWLWR
jgi:hypothetical protein